MWSAGSTGEVTPVDLLDVASAFSGVQWWKNDQIYNTNMKAWKFILAQGTSFKMDYEDHLNPKRALIG